MSRKSSQGQLNHRSGSQTTSQYTTLNRRSTALPSSPILSAEQQSDFHLTTTLHIRESSLQPGWYLATTTFTLLNNGSKGPKSYLDKIPTEGLRLGLIVTRRCRPGGNSAINVVAKVLSTNPLNALSRQPEAVSSSREAPEAQNH